MLRPMLLITACLAVLSQAAWAKDFWDIDKEVLRSYLEGGSREDLLNRCRAELAAGTAGSYKDELESLVKGLENEPKPPAGYEKPAAKRTKEEAIRSWIYDLREERTEFATSWAGTPSDHLVCAGADAIDALIETLDDYTPSRKVGLELGISLTAILRRQDLALECIERIAGCSFYRRTGGRGTHLYNDKQRDAVIANVRDWWKEAKGKSQTDGLRIQLRLQKENATLRHNTWFDQDILWKIALIEGPRNVIDDMRQLLGEQQEWLNNDFADNMMLVDPQTVLHDVFGRFWEYKGRRGEYYQLLRYGDKQIYQEMARRGALDPGSWSSGDQALSSERHGGSWAIPLVALALNDTKMTGSRSLSNNRGQAFCSADYAIEAFQRLTGKDFGYIKEAEAPERLAAIKRAKDWWDTEGPRAMADKINRDHLVFTDGTDMLDSAEAVAARITILGAPDDAEVRAAVSRFPQIHAYSVQQAILDRFKREPLADQRKLLLSKLGNFVLWQAPTLADFFEHDPDVSVRELAGELLMSVGDKSRSGWWARLESRETALTVIRRVVADEKSPLPVRLKGARVLQRWDSYLDEELLQDVSTQPGLKDDAGLRDYLQRKADRRREIENAAKSNEKAPSP